MKKIVFIITLLSISLLVAVTVQQDEKNDLYLRNLDDNIIQSLKIIEKFNDLAQRNFNTIEGIPTFTNMLMGFTMEMANIRKDITAAQISTLREKDKKIGNLIKIIDPTIEIEKNNRSREQIIQYLGEIEKELKDKSMILRQNIIQEEKKIVHYKKLSSTYFSFHSHHFLYSLLIDYIDSARLLSDDNLVILEQTVMTIQKRLLKEAEKLFEEYNKIEDKK